MARIITSLNEFAGIVDSMEKEYTKAAELSVQKAQRRTQVALIRASTKAAGGDRTLDRVGRATGPARVHASRTNGVPSSASKAETMRCCSPSK